MNQETITIVTSIFTAIITEKVNGKENFAISERLLEFQDYRKVTCKGELGRKTCHAGSINSRAPTGNSFST